VWPEILSVIVTFAASFLFQDIASGVLKMHKTTWRRWGSLQRFPDPLAGGEGASGGGVLGKGASC